MSPDAPPHTTRSWGGKRLRAVVGRVPIGLVCACAVVGLLRVALRDRVALLAPLYYAASPALLAIVLAVAALLWAAGRRWRSAAVAGCLAVLSGVWFHAHMHFSNSPAAPAGATRVMLWNVARGMYGWSNVAAGVRAADADVVGLVEAGDDSPAMHDFWRRELPGYDARWLGKGLLLLVRGDVVEIHKQKLDGGRYRWARVRVGESELSVGLVDIRSDPFRARGPALRHLAQLVQARLDEPLVLMGDFNTPFDSVHFAPLRENLANAFEVAGDGYYATWPLPVPLLGIDHVWVSRRLRVSACRLEWTWASDHRPVVAELATR